MGEIAEMMLDGTMCEGCGVFLDDIIDGYDAPGFPRYCSPQCAGDHGADISSSPRRNTKPNQANFMKVKCTACGKRVKKVGLSQHQRDAHGAKNGVAS